LLALKEEQGDGPLRLKGRKKKKTKAADNETEHGDPLKKKNAQAEGKKRNEKTKDPKFAT